MINKSHLVVTEYQRITMTDKLGEGYKTVTKKQFDALENFVLSNELPDSSNYLKVIQYGSHKCLQAQNYIGVIQLKDGLTIEILPKIAYKSNDNNHEYVRHIVINMLKTLRNSPFKQANTANLKTRHMPLLEVFISMFMESLEQLIRRGIKNYYITIEKNSYFLKGKLLFSDHIKHNLAHDERFYVAFDNYQSNRIENRIIKTTLQHLYKLSRSAANQQRIREALFIFDEMKPVRDIAVAFSKVNLNRQMKDYEQVLIWSRLFLLGESFTPHKGNAIALALMFDMNQLFESYVGAWLKKKHNGKVSLQHTGRYLAQQQNENGNGVFALRPDIVVSDGTTIADTKWKLLNNSDKDKAGISQSDMYQMFAYANKYIGCKRIVLIYPATESTENIDINYCFKDIAGCNDVVNVNVEFFDLDKGFNQLFSLV